MRLLSISSKHLPPPCCVGITQPAQGASSHQAICSAGMTDQTCIAMNINLQRHNSCQLHGVKTGSSMQRDLFFCLGLSDVLCLCSLQQTFVFCTAAVCKAFIGATYVSILTVLTQRRKNFTGERQNATSDDCHVFGCF